MHTPNPSSQEGKARGTKEGQILPQSKFKTSLGYRRPCVKNKSVRRYRNFHFVDEKTESKRQVPSSSNDFSFTVGEPSVMGDG